MQQQQQQQAVRALCVAASHHRLSPQAWTYRPLWQQQQHWQQRRRLQQRQQQAHRLCSSSKLKVGPSSCLAQWTRLAPGPLLLLLVVVRCMAMPSSSSSRGMRLRGAAWLVEGCQKAALTSGSSSSSAA
jgi:hypothetical protein